MHDSYIDGSEGKTTADNLVSINSNLVQLSMYTASIGYLRALAREVQ